MGAHVFRVLRRDRDETRAAAAGRSKYGDKIVGLAADGLAERRDCIFPSGDCQRTQVGRRIGIVGWERRRAEIVQGMLGDVQRALESNDEALTLDIRERDDEVDRCQQQIRAYLTKLAADQRLDRDIASREVGLLNAVSDLENIGDVLDKNLAELVLKKIHGDHSFSREGGAELQEFHRRVSYEFARAVSALASGNTKLASDVILEKAELSKLERELRLRHIQRLHDGRTESIDSSDIHLDVLSNFKRINTHATNLAYVVWGWAADQARFRLQ